MYHCGQRGRVGDGKEGDCRLWWGEGSGVGSTFVVCVHAEIKLQPVVKVT